MAIRTIYRFGNEDRKMRSKALLYIKGTLVKSQTINDSRAFAGRIFSALGYSEHAQEVMLYGFMLDLSKGRTPVVENPAKGTRFEFLLI